MAQCGLWYPAAISIITDIQDSSGQWDFSETYLGALVVVSVPVIDSNNEWSLNPICAKLQFLNGIISPSDLERLTWFASRIRSLTFSKRNPNMFAEGAAYTSLVHALQGKPLFPNLRHLFVVINANESSSLLQLLYSPRLTDLYLIDLREKSLTGPDALYYLQSQSTYQPRLATLILKLPCPSDLLNIAITAFPHLSVLQLKLNDDTTLDFGAHLVNLAKLPVLYQLDLEFQRTLDFSAVEKGSTVCFEKLQHLSVGCVFNDVVLLLSHMTCPKLYSFAHAFILGSNRGRFLPTLEWPTLFDTLRLTAPGLKELYSAPSRAKEAYSEHYDEFVKYYPGVSFSDIAHSLLQFNLVALGFEFPMFHSFTLDDLKSIATSWPRIKFLHVHGAKGPFDDLSASFDVSALEVVALEMPHLRDLSIDLDFSAMRAIKAIPKSYTHPLSRLSMKLTHWKDTVENCAGVVGYVHALFPRLVLLEEFEFKGARVGYPNPRTILGSGGTVRYPVAATMDAFLRVLQGVRFFERVRQGGVRDAASGVDDMEGSDESGYREDCGYPVRLVPVRLDGGCRIVRAVF
ncbi:hypothetical protein CVT24_012245 [Panaeolus cyanescens]|uniref:F-box domain-containing protein n=1 Tax=Panaeolus cyanescens TaxID=181874 RepID=A0A409W5V2_9AGAR|nr:hypothetical protein CVT24_012245 [Panaeolus cyanescens]